jgi:hypothetical protein
MPLSDLTFDGSPSYGSQLITINSTNYIAESFDVTFGVDTQTLLDEYGSDRANVYISRAPSGSMTLQVDSNQARPQRGDSFTVTIDGTSHEFYCTEVQISMSQSDFQKCSISFRKRLTV